MCVCVCLSMCFYFFHFLIFLSQLLLFLFNLSWSFVLKIACIHIPHLFLLYLLHPSITYLHILSLFDLQGFPFNIPGVLLANVPKSTKTTSSIDVLCCFDSWSSVFHCCFCSPSTSAECINDRRDRLQTEAFLPKTPCTVVTQEWQSKLWVHLCTVKRSHASS